MLLADVDFGGGDAVTILIIIALILAIIWLARHF
jgi:hypothetical protein